MAVTIKDIRALRGELGDTNVSLADTRELLYELIKHSDQEREKSSQKFDRELEKSRQKFDRDIKESRQEFDRVHFIAVADRKRMNDFQEKLSHKLGTLVEDFVAPDMRRILHLVSGCPMEDIPDVYVRQRRRLPHDKGQHLEIDAYVECDDLVLINETKESMTVDYIDHFIKNQLTRFREFFPEYREYKLWGCVSSFRMEASLVKYANRQGLITLALSDGLMQIQDTPDFKPKIF
ncbi:hypothetical protein QUF58_05540 [Anaerolineales bacterium HSG24]|nr:hypothetical protein [Anaerolineales bacterium HSG24]